MTDRTGISGIASSSGMGKALAVLALALGLTITAAVWSLETARLVARRDALILERTGAVAAQIRQRLVAYEVALRGGASLFAATDNPSRAQWRAYVSALALDSDYPGIQGVAFSARLAPEQVPALERSVRDEGFAEFEVWPAAQRQAESAIVYIEPLDAANLRALGYDMYSDPVRRQAMQASRDSGKAVLTGPVTLVQDAGDAPPAAVLLYVPLYRHGATVDGTGARALLGWVYAPFRPGDLMASLDRGAEPMLVVRLFDAAPDGTDTLLYADPAHRFAHTSGMTPVRRPVDFAGRRWQLEAFPSVGAASVLESRRPWEYLAGGFVISLLLFGVVWSMATTRDRAHSLALSMTQALRRANEVLDQRVAQRTAALVAANERLRALAEAGVVIGGLPDSGARLEHLAEQARRLVDCACAVLAAPGDEPPLLKATRPLAAGRRAELIAAARAWPRPEVPGLVPDPWGGGGDSGGGLGPRDGPEVLAVPIRVADDRPRGYLYLVHEAGRHFSPEDLAIVRQLMLLAAASVATAEAAEEERRARLEAEAANRSKDRFLAIVSHELRTPLHAILGWLGVVERRGDRGESLQRALTVIRRNAESQNMLIDDLLDLARIEQGKLQIDREPVDLAEVVETVCESQRHVATERQVALEVSAPRGSLVLGDSLRLQQVIGNLLGNALKFTSAGGRVSVALRREGATHVLEVSDDGQGIGPQLLDCLFDPFRQGDTSSRRRHGGLGLGLALVRHIVELHGGQVAARSGGEGCGATFTVRLPRLEQGVQQQVPAASPREAPEVPPQARRVMIVDDYADAREAVAGLLQDEGCAVFEFDGVDASLAWLAARNRSEWPTVVLCDIEMPGRDGYEFLDGLRALEAQRDEADVPLPVIALTAHAGPQDRARMLSHGFLDLVTKPARLERLLSLIGGCRAGAPRHSPADSCVRDER